MEREQGNLGVVKSLWLLQTGKCGMEDWSEKLSEKDERAWCFGVVQTLIGMLTQPLIGYVVLGKLSDISRLQLPLSHL